MLFHRLNVWNIVIIIMLSLLAACGNSSDTASPVYKVEYNESTTPVQGKTTFQIKITKQSDGSAATALHPQLELTMPGMGHGTPIESITESGTAGYYDCSVYYLMGGTWEMKVTVEGETTTFNPSVTSSMGVSTSLYGADDIITGMSGTSSNKYYIFREGPISAPSGTLNLYISHAENMRMNFKPLATGMVLSIATGTVSVTDMLVTASTNSTFPAETSVTTNTSSNGHFSLEGLSGLVSDMTNTIYVKLNVNSQDKTTNGAEPSGTNAYGTLFVMPGM